MKDGVQAITTELEKGTADLPPLASAGKLRYTGRENTKALPRETGGAAAVWKGRTTMPDITAVTHAQNIRYDRKAEALYIIDQTLLPGEEKEIRLQTIDEMVEAIRALRVRGAPAIGICAAYCMYVLAKSIRTEDRPTFLKRLSDYGQAHGGESGLGHPGDDAHRLGACPRYPGPNAGRFVRAGSSHP